MNRTHDCGLYSSNKPELKMPVCICKISKCHRILQNNRGDTIIRMVHAFTKTNGCLKYDQDPLHIMLCRLIKRAGPNHWSFSQCIHKIMKCHRILENAHRDPIINRVHAPIKVHDRAKYELNLWNNVGCRVVMRPDRRTNRWYRARWFTSTQMGWG